MSLKTSEVELISAWQLSHSLGLGFFMCCLFGDMSLLKEYKMWYG